MYNKNIYLIGMMGSGKSTIGKLLSENKNIPLFDMDIELEKLMEMSINKIFNEYGKNRFRLIESTFFNEITKKNYFIYATGGGIILNKKNQKILKNKGITIFLDCSKDILIKRLKKNLNMRPLLQNNFENNINIIYNDRYDIYKSCAHFIIDTSSLSPNIIINKIKKYLDA